MLRILALLTLALPALVAHEGHHEAASVLWHVLTAPDHLGLLVGALVVTLGGAWLLLRRGRALSVRDEA